MQVSKGIFHLKVIKKVCLHPFGLLNFSYNILYHKLPLFLEKQKEKRFIWGPLMSGKRLPLPISVYMEQS